MTTETTAIVYPETDGMPLPDGEYQAPLYRDVVSTLETHFENVPNSKVNGNTFIYYREGDPRRSVSPDCYVALHLSEDAAASIERNNVYLLWEVGKAPDFVLEIGSESTARNDMTRKRTLYAELGVQEYWRYDASGGDFYDEPLVGETLLDDEYVRLEQSSDEEGRLWSHSAVLNLDLCWDEGVLRFWDPVANVWLLNHREEHEGRLQAEAESMQQREGRLQERAGRLQEREGRLREQEARLQEREERLTAEARIAELEAELRRYRGE